MVVIDATDFDGTVSRGDMRWQNGTASGSTGGGIMTTNDNGYMFGGNYDKKAPRLDYRVNPRGGYLLCPRPRAGAEECVRLRSCWYRQPSHQRPTVSFFNRDGLSWSIGRWMVVVLRRFKSMLPAKRPSMCGCGEQFKLDKLVLTKDATFSGTGTEPTTGARTTC